MGCHPARRIVGFVAAILIGETHSAAFRRRALRQRTFCTLACNVPAKKRPNLKPPTSAERVKDVCAAIRRARSLWDAHRNAACRAERAKAIERYEALTPAEREQVPDVLRVWLRYRSEKYFGAHTTPPQRANRENPNSRN